MKWRLVLLAAILLTATIFTAPVLSQGGTQSVERIDTDIVTQTQIACQAMIAGSVCATVDGVLADGDPLTGIVPTENITELTTEVEAVAVLQVLSGPTDDDERALLVSALGETTLTSIAVPEERAVCRVTNISGSDVNILTEPDFATSLSDQLTPGEGTFVDGRTSDGVWYRTQVGAAPGWVPTERVGIDCERTTLTETAPDDLLSLYREPFTAVTLSEGTLLLKSPVDGAGYMLLNDVLVAVSGAAQATIDADGLTFVSIAGTTTLQIDAETVTLQPGEVAAVAAEAISKVGVTDLADAPALVNSLLGGQSAQASLPRLGFALPRQTVISGQAVPFAVQLSGDIGTCEAEAAQPLDVVVALDVSATLTEERAEAATTAIEALLTGLHPQDQSAIVLFNEQANLVRAFEADGQAVGTAESLQTNVDALYDIPQQRRRSLLTRAISTASTQFQLLPPNERDVPIVVVISDSEFFTAVEGISDLPEGTRIVTIGYGDGAFNEALANTASSPADAYAAADAADLLTLMRQMPQALTAPQVAEDIEVSFRAYTDAFAVLDAPAAFGLAETDADIVTWKVPALYTGQVFELPLTLQAEATGESPLGEVTLSYLTCDGERVRGTVPTATIVVESGEVPLLAGAASGVIRPLGQQRRALTPLDGEALMTVRLAGDDSVRPVVPGASVVYTRQSATPDPQTTYVFSLPDAAPRSLILQNRSPADSAAYTLTVEAGAGLTGATEIAVNGGPLQDEPTDQLGAIYLLDGADEGDTLTVRLTADELRLSDLTPQDIVTSPVRLVSLDGSAADEVFTRFDEFNNQWISVQRLRGSSGYLVDVSFVGVYQLEVESGNRLTEDRGAFPLGRRLSFQSGEERVGVFDYTLEVPQDQRISVIRTRPTRTVTNELREVLDSRLQLLDGDNRRVLPVATQTIVGLTTETYELAAGTYRVLLQSEPTYELSIAPGEVDQNLRGVVNFEQTIADVAPKNAPFALYELVSGSLGGVREGDIITIRLEGETDDREAVSTAENLTLTGAGGQQAEVVETLFNLTALRLNGEPPYRLAIEGLTEFDFNITDENLLDVERGPIVFDQTIRDSTALPSFVTYDLTPALGKKLINGDQITIRYEGPYDRDRELPLTRVLDKDGAVLPTVQQFLLEDENRDRRTFIGVYELTGTPPYRLRVPNEGSYVVTFESGNTYQLDVGNIAVDSERRERTDGPQLVTYDVLAEAGELFTLRLSPISAETISEVVMENAVTRAEVGSPRLTQIFVFTLQEDGPQRLSFETDGTYEISLEAGDQLTEDRGAFFLGDAEQVEIEEGPKLVTYEFEITEPQALSVQFGGSDRYQWQIQDPDGDEVPRVNILFAYDDTTRRFLGNYEVFDLEETGTYTFAIEVLESNLTYSLSLLPNTDILNVDKGNFFLDTTELDTLDRNIRFATYTINAQEGEIITVEVLDERERLQRDDISDDTVIEITNANGNPISRLERLTRFDGQYTSSYELTGPGPYTMRLQPDRPGREFSAFNAHQEYQLSVNRGDTLRADQGTLGQNQIAMGEIEGPGRRVAFTLDSQLNEGNIATLRLTRPGTSTQQFGTLVDADNNEILAINASTSAPNVSLAAYQLTGNAPYTFYFDATGSYELELVPDNLLVQPFTALPINPIEPVVVVDDNGNEQEQDPLEASNSLEGDAVVGRYTLDGDSGDLLTIQASQSGSTPSVEVRDSNGNIIVPQDRRFDFQNSYFVYAFAQSDTYQIDISEINPATAHTVRVTESNVLVADGAPLPLNPEEPVVVIDDNGNEQEQDPLVVENQLNAPAQFVVHPLDASGGSTVTLDFSQINRRDLNARVLDADGITIKPTLESERIDGTQRRVFDLPAGSDYALLLEPSSSYEVKLTAGDGISTTGAVVPIGILEEPFEAELQDPFQEVVHPLAPLNGSVLTLQLENSNRPIEMTLRNGDGDVLDPLVRDFQIGSNYEVYLLSGQPPFTVSFRPQGSYTLTALAGNILLSNAGIVSFNEEQSGRIESPVRAIEYTIDARRNQIITTQARVGGLTQDGELRDANGRLWEPILTAETGGRRYNVYLLGGPPPYELIFDGQTTYNVTVNDSDVVTDVRGMVIFGEEISERSEAPSQVFRYLIDGSPGQEISVNLQVNGLPVQPTLFDNEGRLLIRNRGTEKNGRNYSTYVLTGPTPYIVEFEASGAYQLNVTEGDVLTQQPQPLLFGETARGQFDTPAITGQFAIDAQTGQVVTTQVQANGQPAESELVDSSGNVLDPLATFEKQNSEFNVYEVSGEAPYTLRMDTEQAIHAVTVTEGNALIQNQGVIRFGNDESESLTQPAELAVYTIDALPGETISLEITANGQPVESEVRDADGAILQPQDRALVTTSAYTSYVLSGPPPYRVSFAPVGRYTITLEQGDFTLAQQGPAVFGDTIRNRLTLPQSVAVYTVNTSPDQLVTLQVTDTTRREFFAPQFTDANGVDIPVLTEVLEQTTRKVTVVYDLTGTQGPYTIQFEPQISTYEFLLERGDTTDFIDRQLGQ